MKAIQEQGFKSGDLVESNRVESSWAESSRAELSRVETSRVKIMRRVEPGVEVLEAWTWDWTWGWAWGWGPGLGLQGLYGNWVRDIWSGCGNRMHGL